MFMISAAKLLLLFYIEKIKCRQMAIYNILQISHLYILNVEIIHFYHSQVLHYAKRRAILR